MSNTFYGLPEKVKFCKKCVISNQRPNSVVEFRSSPDQAKKTIAFDKNGICDACNFHILKHNHIDWNERENSLSTLLDKYRRNDGSYDVIVPGSGGKDSAYTAHILKEKYGMNPLTVTWAPHSYTDIGRKNFENWINEGGLDNLLFTPNGKLHRFLTQQAFINLLHPFQPFIVGQRLIGPLMAKKFGVQLVMYGENQAEDGNNIDENKLPYMDPKFYSNSDGTLPTLSGKSIKELCDLGGFDFREFAPYIAPPSNEFEEAGICVYYLGYFHKWDAQECYYYACENTGFMANDERTEGTYSKYSSIDDKIDTFHYYTTLIKFGLGRASYDAAQEIRTKKISREEGVALVKKFDCEFPEKYFEYFLKYIDISEKKFWETIEQFRSPHLWKNGKNGWELRNPIWKEMIE